ncbi:MAG: hypothetical protein NVS9B1_26730 [Candidatus Dormibacteraceae bacterium]
MLRRRDASAPPLIFGALLVVILVSTSLRLATLPIGSVELPNAATANPSIPARPASEPSPAELAAAADPVPEPPAVAEFGPIAPAALASDGLLLYCADVSRSQVIARSLTGGPWRVIAGNGFAGFAGDGGAATVAQLNSPTGLAHDSEGNLYIADSGNHAIRRVDRSGNIITVAGTGRRGYSGDGGAAAAALLDTPAGVAAGPDGAIFIADKGNNRIRRVARDGIITTVAGDGEVSLVGGSGGFGFSGDGGPATAAQLSGPEGVLAGRRGDFYIADTGNDRVRHVDALGTITTIAGSGRNGPFGDGGPALAAGMIGPVGLAMDASGRLYISERDGQLVRRLEAGILTRVAGVGRRGGKAGELNDPAGLALVGDALYLAELGSGQVRLIPPGG